ncbi:hypothetical protein [Microlunatus soli]|uniref:Uncharacterized protein n=1 Tax=Microlunatus soli TaxID=630515 RepID=A0A1H1XJ22_9ACTN|nr:hypothetical protein [Microlunatus soli]SDT09210.1 hypothetical protein SAMN04489812_4105 [Microlunatus soli]
MFTWVHRDGFDWQLIEPPEGQQSGPSAPTYVLGVTFGYGAADEPLTDLGSLRCAAAVIRSELRRPIELPGGGVGTAEVEAVVGSDTSTFTVAGSVDVLTAAWQGLALLFAAPRIEEDQGPLPAQPFPWPTDRTVRYGLDALALNALEDVTTDLAAAAHRRLTELDPAAGQVRCTFFTTSELLLGTATGPGNGGRPGFVAPTVPAAPADGGPPLAANTRRGSLPAPNDQLMLSTSLPSTLDGLVAAQLIATRSGNTFEAVNATGRDTFVNLAGMRSEHYLAIGNAAAQSPQDRERILPLLIDDLTTASDEQIETELLSVAMDVSPGWARRSRTLGLDDAAPTVAGVRQALRSGSDGVHLALVAGRPAPEAFPMLREQLPPEKGKTFHSWGRQRLTAGYSTAVADVRIGRRTLTTYQNGNVDGRKVPAVFQQIDLNDAGLVIADPAGRTTIVDRALRSLDLMVSGFRGSQKLQRQLDDRLRDVPVLRVATSPIDIETHRQAIRRAKRLWVFAFVGPILVMAVLIGAAVAQQLATDDPIDLDTSVGESAKLSNGTVITVTEVDPVVHDHDATVRVHVRFCAGKDTDADGAPADVRRRVSPSDFAFYDGYATGQRTTTSTELPRRTLASGECVEGDVGFRAMSYTGGQDKVSYRNEVGDKILWRQ